MRRVLRIAVLAGGIAATLDVSAASASNVTPARLWDGAVVITDATPQCQAFGQPITGGLRALYRPHLRTTDPNAAIIVQSNSLSHIVVVRAATDTRTMQGNAPYCGIDFDPAMGESTTWLGGTYNLNVTPANITATTPEIRVTGKVTKFFNIPGCTITLRGAFLRRP